MSISTRSAITFPIALLSLLALLTFWINKAVQPSAPKLDGSSRHDPDYIISNFVTTQTDKIGALRFKLAATEMQHFPDDDTTSLQRPRYTQFVLGNISTQVEGLRGYVSSDGEEVELVDNVKITRQAIDGKGEMTVDTEYLNILPNEELVRTESPVVIRQEPKTVIYATGMVYEKKERTVTLLHNVRAHYEKPKDKTPPVESVDKQVNINPVNNTDHVAISKPPSAKQQKKSKHTKINATKSNTNNARIRRRYD